MKMKSDVDSLVFARIGPLTKEDGSGIHLISEVILEHVEGVACPSLGMASKDEELET